MATIRRPLGSPVLTGHVCCAQISSLSDLWTGVARFHKLLRAPPCSEFERGRVARTQKSLRLGTVWPEIWNMMNATQKIYGKHEVSCQPASTEASRLRTAACCWSRMTLPLCWTRLVLLLAKSSVRGGDPCVWLPKNALSARRETLAT